MELSEKPKSYDIEQPNYGFMPAIYLTYEIGKTIIKQLNIGDIKISSQISAEGLDNLRKHPNYGAGGWITISFWNGKGWARLDLDDAKELIPDEFAFYQAEKDKFGHMEEVRFILEDYFRENNVKIDFTQKDKTIAKIRDATQRTPEEIKAYDSEKERRRREETKRDEKQQWAAHVRFSRKQYKQDLLDWEQKKWIADQKVSQGKWKLGVFSQGINRKNQAPQWEATVKKDSVKTVYIVDQDDFEKVIEGKEYYFSECRRLVDKDHLKIVIVKIHVLPDKPVEEFPVKKRSRKPTQ